jgi:hypothetical protein
MFDCRTIHGLIEGNPSAIHNRLIYWCLTFELRPQFQRLPKIQHRLSVWVAQNPVGSGAPKKARYGGEREVLERASVRSKD